MFKLFSTFSLFRHKGHLIFLMSVLSVASCLPLLILSSVPFSVITPPSFAPVTAIQLCFPRTKVREKVKPPGCPTWSLLSALLSFWAPCSPHRPTSLGAQSRFFLPLRSLISMALAFNLVSLQACSTPLYADEHTHPDRSGSPSLP